MGGTPGFGWLVRFGVTFALLWGCCWAVPRVFANLPQFPPTTTDQEQADVLNRYFDLPLQDVVLVGTSLSFRLKELYFEHGGIRNASLPGGSSLTGLAIIAAAPTKRPRVIAVEVNFLTRPVDTNLLDRFKSARRQQAPLPPFRTLAAYYQSARDDALTYSKARLEAIIAQPAAPDHSELAVASNSVEWQKPVPRELMLENARVLKTLTEELETQGVKVFFYELPYPSQLNQSLYATATREVLASVIRPDDRRRLTLHYSLGDLRSFGDGIHVDDRSAVILAAALDDAIRKKRSDDTN
jgi:hypothetical protein